MKRNDLIQHCTRTACALAAVLLLPGLVAAEPKALVEPREIDLGEIGEGNAFERYIELTNAGDGVLILEDVKTSCGCTAAAVEGNVELKAGESERIRVTFNSRNMEGDVKKKVTVVTNDPEMKYTEVLVKANVHRPVRWEPKYISLERLEAGSPFEATVTVEADPELSLEVLGAEVLGGVRGDKESRLFEVTVGERRRLEERDAVDFTVKLRPDQKPQRISETLVITTNIADRDTVRVPIRGDIEGRLTFRPSYAVLAMVEPGEETTREVVVSASEGTFQVLSAEVPDSPVTVAVMPGGRGQQTVLRLTYKGETPGANGVRQLRIQTDDPDQSLIEIPVRYQTRAIVAGQ